ncbi:MAG TPA: hypothetical protein VNB94_12465 [Mycobacteriales bacterium]|nr:hypothetical protein [Mycobacteriales bacterium]
MSITLTARSRALVVLLVMALVVLTGYTAFASGDRSGHGPIGRPATGDVGAVVDAPLDQHETQIGTALKMVRNADGSVTTTES